MTSTFHLLTYILIIQVNISFQESHFNLFVLTLSRWRKTSVSSLIIPYDLIISRHLDEVKCRPTKFFSFELHKTSTATEPLLKVYPAAPLIYRRLIWMRPWNLLRHYKDISREFFFTTLSCICWPMQWVSLQRKSRFASNLGKRWGSLWIWVTHYSTPPLLFEKKECNLCNTLFRILFSIFLVCSVTRQTFALGN